MSQPIAQRTLVKSPPELWAEISDVEALARHLGAFGEIRITRVVPETTVAWEGETARGTVELSASGWGTKVTLTATPTQDAASPIRPARPAPPEVQPIRPTPPSIQPLPAAPATLPPAATAPDSTKAEPSDSAWGSSAGQKVQERYLGAAPKPAATTRAPVAAAPSPTAEPSAASEPARSPSGKHQSAPTTKAEENVISTPQPATPPRGLLAKIRYWFGAPDPTPQPALKSEPAEPAAAREPVGEAEGTPSEPVSDTEPVEPVESVAASQQRTPPPRVKETTPRSVTLSEPVAGSTTTAPERVARQAAPAPDAVAPQAAHAPDPVTADPTPAPAQHPVDEGTIVGILTAVLDELGSAHHRPFSRPD